MKKKILFLLSGVLASLVLLELGLRLLGFTYLYFQEQGNKRSSKTKDTYKILCLGDSTTAGQYPKYLEEELNSRGMGISFSVIDKGRPCSNSNYILANLNKYLDQYEPDLVITMMGINDSISDVVVYEQEQAESYYKKLKTYKLMRLINPHLENKIREIKNDAGSIAGRACEGIRMLREVNWMKINGTGKSMASRVLGNELKYVEKGHYYRDTGNYKEAEELYKKALSVNPAYEAAWLGLASNYGNMGRWEEVDKIFRNLIKTNPKDELAYLHSAHWYMQQNKYIEAEYLLKKVLEINPKNKWGYIKLGNCYMEQKRYKDAQKLYRKVIELDPKDGQVYFNLGDYYRELLRYKEAQKLYEKGIELNPNSAQVYLALGDCYMQQRKYKQAEKPYIKAMELDPNNKQIDMHLWHCYSLQGKYREIEKLFSKIKLTPKQREVLYAYVLQNKHYEVEKLVMEGMKLENDMKSDEKADYLNDKDLEIKYDKIVDKTRTLYLRSGTIYNYRKLSKILKDRNITYVCVQYPLRKAADLKSIFESDKGIVFVDNENVFKACVEKEGYDAYFLDKFAGDFGHCTDKGNKLLARNIADTIIREVFSPARRDVANLNSR